MTLMTEANLTKPDEVYARLLDAHAGCDAAASQEFNARLILMNHIGDERILTEAIETAKASSGRIDI
jgi:hypothetical protein